jgi:alpha-glucosidase
MQRTWWQQAVGYQIYVPSFQDSNGDGWGDLPGVTARLDYLQDLGVDLLWLTPFFPSPMRDHGYDIADYREVDPRFGALGDLDHLLAEAHRRSMRVLLDLVVNHTSTEHEWFRRSRSSREGPYRDYYIWRDPASDGGPPNNWLSHFGGPAWTFDDATGQYYLHLFACDQPDLNWDHPPVAGEIDDVLRFWLRRGADGFRIDTAAYLIKHPGLPDNPPLREGELSPVRGVAPDWRKQDHRYDVEQPGVVDVHRRWRKIADEFGALLIGEIYMFEPSLLAAYLPHDGLNMSFWFGLVDADWNPAAMRTALAAAAEASSRLAWVQSNHDRSRAVSRYGGGALGRRRFLSLLTLTAGLPGVPFLYQGDELGLEDGILADNDQQDPLAAADPSVGRDRARTPMPWRPGPGLGFTTAPRAWLQAEAPSPEQTVETQLSSPSSTLQATRRLLSARRAFQIPADAKLTWIAHDGVIAFERAGMLFAANLSYTPAPFPDPSAWLPVYDSHAPVVSTVPAVLAPYQAMVARRRG